MKDQEPLLIQQWHKKREDQRDEAQDQRRWQKQRWKRCG